MRKFEDLCKKHSLELDYDLKERLKSYYLDLYINGKWKSEQEIWDKLEARLLEVFKRGKDSTDGA